MSSIKAALCIGTAALIVSATGAAIEPPRSAGPDLRPHQVTLDTVRAEAARKTGTLVAPWLDKRRNDDAQRQAVKAD